MKNRKYFSLEKAKKTATLNIYGEITSWPWFEGDVSASNLSKQLEALTDVDEINVYINSYGGEVAEGLAIYNALRRHNAKVRTFCDGFACSIASVIFMAGEERIMNESSLLMIHNAWSCVSGNAAELRKQADDLEKITEASVKAYKAHSSLAEEEIKALLDAESWISPEEAVSYGFATAIEKAEQKAASQNALSQLFKIIRAHQENLLDDEEPENAPDDEEQENPETDVDTGEEETDGENPDDESEEPEEETDGENLDDESEEPEETDGENPDDESGNDPETDTDDEPEDDETSEDDSDEENTENPTQKWCGFFNALLKN